MTDANGLYYMRARYYDPKLKRFINRDVIRGDVLDGQTFNRYAYVNGDPVSFIDPLGLFKCPNKVTVDTDRDGIPNISQRHDDIAHGGYYGRKQERINEYITSIADRNKIVGDNTNGYRLTEPTKWMENMGMVQIKERLKRKSWTDTDGSNWQWDSQHGKLEKWNRRRTEHLGEFDPVTGKQTKSGESSRRWDG